MTTKPKPHIHGRDHEHGGADPTKIHWEDVGGAGTGGGGIQFDTTPQAGEFLQVTANDWMNLETEGTLPLNIDANGTGDINLYSAGGSVNVDADSGFVVDVHGDNGIVLDANGDGDIVLHASGSGATSIKIQASASGGHWLILQGLPTSDPGVTGAVWNDGGTLKIS